MDVGKFSGARPDPIRPMLWAALLAVSLLGETVGPEGVLGGAAFLLAVFLAATAPPPDPDCGEENCEI